MTLLGRYFGSRDDVPGWAKFLSLEEYRRFLDVLGEELNRRSLPFEIGDGTVHVSPPGEESGDYGLLNLAQVCHATPPTEWAGSIRAHFDHAFLSSRESEEFDARAESLDLVRPHLKVRLYHLDYRDQMGAVGIIHRVPAEGLIETLVYDLPGTVRTVPPDHAKKWAVPEAELFRIGLENVKAERPAPVEQSFTVGKGAAIRTLVGDSFFTTSHALFLGNYLGPPPAYGALVAVPHRHAVLYHLITDLRVIEVVNSMIPIAFGMYQEGPGSLSSSLYWWRSGTLTFLPSKVTAQSVTFSPPGVFVEEVLNRVPEPDGAP